MHNLYTRIIFHMRKSQVVKWVSTLPQLPLAPNPHPHPKALSFHPADFHNSISVGPNIRQRTGRPSWTCHQGGRLSDVHCLCLFIYMYSMIYIIFVYTYLHMYTYMNK